MLDITLFACYNHHSKKVSTVWQNRREAATQSYRGCTKSKQEQSASCRFTYVTCKAAFFICQKAAPHNRFEGSGTQRTQKFPPEDRPLPVSVKGETSLPVAVRAPSYSRKRTRTMHNPAHIKEIGRLFCVIQSPRIKFF